ncbi:MAG: hypothetical protein ABIR37_03985, partial [Candidatus Saccharimonadales bacterium]
DAEEVLSGNIRDEAAHVAEIEVPTAAISDVDVTEDPSSDEFSIIETDEQGNPIEEDVALIAADDNQEEEA